MAIKVRVDNKEIKTILQTNSEAKIKLKTDYVQSSATKTKVVMPIKGVDYFTQEDIEEIKEQIESSLADKFMTEEQVLQAITKALGDIENGNY